MGRPFFELLEGPGLYSCKHCRTPLALQSDVISKQFHSKNGRAYLFERVANVTSGPKEERLMTTGPHIVSDLQCAGCLMLVGWRYDEASDATQKYKENKFILERCRVADFSRVGSMLRGRRFGEDSDSE